MNKKLICYFSASGNTKKIAEQLAKIVGGDLFEIKPLEDYTAKDLDWQDKNSRSSLETADSTSRPAIKKTLNSIEDYKTIFIGYPIWWDLAPRIINTFIESINLENKKVYLFATSGGSGVSASLDNLKDEYKNIDFISAERLSESVSRDEIRSWLGE